jgi:hypothetical protein
VACGLILAMAASLLLSSSGGSRPLVVREHAVTLTLNEYSITPRAVSVPAGTLRITAYNAGILPHNLTVAHYKLDSNGERVILTSTGTILPAASRTITVEVSRAARYTLASTIANQADLGMTATLIVR